MSVGSTGGRTARNAQGLANAAWHASFTWANPALVSLKRQIEVPMFGEDPVEMGVNDGNRAQVLARFAADAHYRGMFAAAFPEDAAPIRFGSAIKALAVFVRGLVSNDSRYDRHLHGEYRLSERERRGEALFFGEKAECFHCHGSFNFNDQVIHRRSRHVALNFHNTGLYDIDGRGGYPEPNRGVFELSGEPADMGRFRAPSLRNVAVTAPYLHDGSIATLREVLDVYAAGGRNIVHGPYAGDGRANPHRSELVGAIDLDEEDRLDLLAFLETLTDPAFLASPRYADPFAAAEKEAGTGR